MKKILLTILCVAFATGVFAQTPQPLSDNYIGCVGDTVIAGFVVDPNIEYKWYSEEGAHVFTQYTNKFIINSEYPADGKTFWVQPVINGVATGPRIPVTVTRSDNCGELNPTGCYATGNLLFKEDFGGNLPADPEYGPALPLAVTEPYTYINANVGGQHGKYTIKKTSFVWYGSWWENPLLNDHTNPGDPTRGYMFITDAGTESGQFYKCTINNLCPGSNLSFSAWVVSMATTLKPSRVNLTFVVEDAVTHRVLARFCTGNIPEPDRNWRSYGFHFVPTSSNIILRILNNCKTGTNGNDFCLDDIEIRVCTPPIITPITEFSVCAGTEFSLTPIFENGGSFAEPLEYQWFYSPNGATMWAALPNQTNFTLNINPFAASNVGYYRLEITGAGGMANNTTCRSVSDIIHLVLDPQSSVVERTLSICQNDLPYSYHYQSGTVVVDKLFDVGTISGTYTLHQPTPGNCDNIVLLHLTVNPYKTKSISKAICQGEQYNFYGRQLNTSGTYEDTIPAAVGCDTIVTLILKVNPTFTEPVSLTYCRSELPKVWRGITFGVGTESGIIVYPRTTINGCDSTVTLDLTILESFFTDIYDTICWGQVRPWHGSTYIESGDYPVTLASTTSHCDSIVTLHLTVLDNVTVDVGIQTTICANDNGFKLFLTPKSPDAAMPTNYSIVFDNSEIPDGFDSFITPQESVITGNEIDVIMPPKVYPNHYSLTVTLSNDEEVCGSPPVTFSFTVLYPDTIMVQKWNNVIAILNYNFNGGFKFIGYEWHDKNDFIVGDNSPNLYIGATETFAEGDEYYVKLTRSDGSVIATCPFTTHLRQPPTPQYPTLISPNGAIRFEIKSKSAVARIWSVTGILVSSTQINHSGQEIYAPSQQGMYLLEIISDNRSREVVPIVVK